MSQGNNIDGRELRDAFGRFLTGVTVITIPDAGDGPSGMTANSFSSVSLDPPLLLFCLARNADCYEPFQNATHFAVNILASDQAELSTRFATKNIDKWEGTDFSVGNNGSPLLVGNIAAFEAKITARHDGGDHVIYVGEVESLHTTAEDNFAPLGFFQGKYRALDG